MTVTIARWIRPKRATRGGKLEVFLMAYPTVIALLGHAVMGFADTMMVGALGAQELGAVGFTNIAYFTTVALFMGTIQIVNTFASQEIGAGHPARASRWAWQAMYVAVMAWPALLSVGFIVDDLFAVFGPSAEVQRHGVTYARIRLIGSGPFLCAVALVYFFRGVGHVKIPMVNALGMQVLNLGLDYVLIFGKFGFPALGVAGAAWASVITVAVSAAGLMLVFLSQRMHRRFRTRRTVRPRPDLIVRFLRVGVPSGVHGFMDIGSFTIFLAFVGRMGDVQLAANQIALQVCFLGFNVCHAFSVATTTLVGQYIGARKTELAVQSAYSAAHLLFYYLLGITAVVAVFPEDLLQLFAHDERVVTSGVVILYLCAIFLVFDGMGVIAAGALRGAGDTRYCMIVAMTMGWLFFLPLAYVGGEVLHGGAFGAWVGATIYVISLAALYINRFQRGRWKTMRI